MGWQLCFTAILYTVLSAPKGSPTYPHTDTPDCKSYSAALTPGHPFSLTPTNPTPSVLEWAPTQYLFPSLPVALTWLYIPLYLWDE